MTGLSRQKGDSGGGSHGEEGGGEGPLRVPTRGREHRLADEGKHLGKGLGNGRGEPGGCAPLCTDTKIGYKKKSHTTECMTLYIEVTGAQRLKHRPGKNVLEGRGAKPEAGDL